jgi:hydroxymethylbilane synthase
MLPAVGQGALAVECRTADDEAIALLSPLHDPATAACVTAERAMLAALDGSCRTPIAGLATIAGDRLTLDALLLSEDGGAERRGQESGAVTDAQAIGSKLGERLRRGAGPEFGFG